MPKGEDVATEARMHREKGGERVGEVKQYTHKHGPNKERETQNRKMMQKETKTQGVRARKLKQVKTQMTLAEELEQAFEMSRT